MDFYVYMGIPVARTWPRKPKLPRAPATQPYIQLFREAMHAWGQLPAVIRTAYEEQARGSGLMGRDLWVRGYIKGLDY